MARSTHQARCSCAVLTTCGIRSSSAMVHLRRVGHVVRGLPFPVLDLGLHVVDRRVDAARSRGRAEANLDEVAAGVLTLDGVVDPEPPPRRHLRHPIVVSHRPPPEGWLGTTTDTQPGPHGAPADPATATDTHDSGRLAAAPVAGPSHPDTPTTAGRSAGRSLRDTDDQPRSTSVKVMIR